MKKEKEDNKTKKEKINYIGEPSFLKLKSFEAVEKLREICHADNLLDERYDATAARHCEFLESVIDSTLPDTDVIFFRIGVPVEFFKTEEDCIKWNDFMDELTKVTAGGIQFTSWKVTLTKQEK
jgi:hypothetical protein